MPQRSFHRDTSTSSLLAESSASTLGDGVYRVSVRAGEEVGIAVDRGPATVHVLVLQTTPGGACGRAGVERGTFHSLHGCRISSKEDLVAAVGRIKADGVVEFPLVVDTVAGRRQYTVQLKDQRESLGVEYAVVCYEPAVITAVASGGPGHRSGLRAGQVIHAVDSQACRTSEEAASLLQAAQVRLSGITGEVLVATMQSSVSQRQGSGMVAFNSDMPVTPGSEALGATLTSSSPRSGRRSPGLSAPRRRGSGRSQGQAAEQPADYADVSMSSMLGMSVTSVQADSFAGAGADGPPSPARVARPRRRRSGMKGQTDSSQLPTPPASPDAAALALGTSSSAVPQPCKAAERPQAPPVVFTDTDGDRVALIPSERGGLSLVVNDQELATLFTLRYHLPSGSLIDAIGNCVLPLSKRLQLEREVAGLAEACGVSHNIPLDAAQRVAIILWSPDEPLGIEFNVLVNGTVVVTGTTPGGPAFRSNLPLGQLLEIDGETVVGADGLQARIQAVRDLARKGRASFQITMRVLEAEEPAQAQCPLIAVEQAGPCPQRSGESPSFGPGASASSASMDSAMAVAGASPMGSIPASPTSETVRRKKVVVVKKKKKSSSMVESPPERTGTG